MAATGAKEKRAMKTYSFYRTSLVVALIAGLGLFAGLRAPAARRARACPVPVAMHRAVVDNAAISRPRALMPSQSARIR
jgi:hypothetical protein